MFGNGKIEVACPGCAMTLAVPVGAAGKTARCPSCETKFKIPATAAGAHADPGVASLVPPVVTHPVNVEPRGVGSDGSESSNQWPGPQVDQNTTAPAKVTLTWLKPETPASYPSGIAWRKIGVGIAMMIGAVVWFVAGMAMKRFFIYPPILFVLGIVTVVKGLIGKHD